jgi:hypothetical protein
MARIQITDLNSSDSELMDELTDEDLFEINGGGGFTWRGFNRWINSGIRGIGRALDNSGTSIEVGYSTSGGWQYGIRR